MGQPITTNKFSKTADRLESKNTFSLLEYSVVYLDFKNSTGSFVKSFHKCLLSTYYVPGTMLDAANTIIKYIRSTYIFYHHVDIVCCFPEKLSENSTCCSHFSQWPTHGNSSSSGSLIGPSLPGTVCLGEITRPSSQVAMPSYCIEDLRLPLQSFPEL